MDKKIINNPIHNSGLILEPPQEKDWILGGVSGATAQVIFKDAHGWLKYQRPEETQANRNFDTFSCVTFASLKSLSYYFKVVHGLDMDFSERFTAVMSGTKPGRGNSARAVLESIRKHGFILEKDYPSLTENMTENEWFAYPPKAIRDKALKNLEDWKIEWEAIDTSVPVPHSKIIEAQKKGVPIISVYAWASYLGDGVYYDYNNTANHMATSPEHEDNHPIVDIIADDSYPKDFSTDPRPDADYIKRLAKTFKIYSAHVITAQPKKKINLINFKPMSKNLQGYADNHGLHFYFVKEINGVEHKQLLDVNNMTTEVKARYIDDLETGIIKTTSWVKLQPMPDHVFF